MPTLPGAGKDACATSALFCAPQRGHQRMTTFTMPLPMTRKRTQLQSLPGCGGSTMPTRWRYARGISTVPGLPGSSMRKTRSPLTSPFQAMMRGCQDGRSSASALCVCGLFAGASIRKGRTGGADVGALSVLAINGSLAELGGCAIHGGAACAGSGCIAGKGSAL